MADNKQQKQKESNEFFYKCPVEECNNQLSYFVPKGEIWICGPCKKVCNSCHSEGWRHLSGHGGAPRTWNERDLSNSDSD